MTSSRAGESLSIGRLSYWAIENSEATSRDFQSRNRQITQSAMLLLIGNHPLYFAEIAIADQRGRAQLAFAFLGFGRQHVTQAGMPALHFAVGRFLEPLGGAFVRF